MSSSADTNRQVDQNDQNATRANALIFVAAYACQGISQHFCLVAQPLNNFFRGGLRLDASAAAFYISVLMVPWVVKPIYGLVSDRLGLSRPGAGRRRLLIAMHIAAGLLYLIPGIILHFPFAAFPGQSGDGAILAPAANPAIIALARIAPAAIAPAVIAFIAMAGICIAFTTVVLVAMTVDAGHQGESARGYFGLQALAYSLTNIAAMAAGGFLCSHYSPQAALAGALVLASLPLFFLVPLLRSLLPIAPGDADQSHSADAQSDQTPPQTKEAQPSLPGRLKMLFSSAPFLCTMLFMIMWNLSPSLGVSLYYYECDKLHFTQGQIGMLAACTSTGTLAGAFVFKQWLCRFFTGGRSTYVLVAMGALSNLSYLLLVSPETGMAIEFFRGFATFVATLAIYGLAADVSPPRLTATAMALLIAVFNIAMEGSIALGGFLYAKVFAANFLPLIMVSSVTTLLTGFLVPGLTPKGCKKG